MDVTLVLVFIFLYALMCVLWSIFCIRVQHAMYGKSTAKDIFSILINTLLAPISIIFGIYHAPEDFGQLRNSIEDQKNRE